MKHTFLFVFCIALASSAQISVDAISTDTVDIFSKQRQQADRIPSGISWLSLLVPGSSHQIIGSGNKALGYITIDIFALTGAIFFRNYSNRLASNYKAYAVQYADIPSAVSDDFFWQIIGNFDSYSDYQQTLDLVRDNENRFSDERYLWKWQDESYRKKYISFQKVAKKFSTVSSFFIGALVLNRIVSFVDIRTMLKNSRFKSTTLSFKPVSFDRTTNGIVLQTTF